MVLKKKRNGNKDNILFIDASKYFSSEKTMNVITETDINRIVDTYKARTDIERFAHVATLDEIRSNDYNCNIPRYVDSFEQDEYINVDAQTATIKELTAQSDSIEKELEKFFKELGLGV